MKWFSRALLVPAFALGLIFAVGADLPSLSGVANFRDIGGYRTSDGRVIKRHEIYRSGELSGLTPADDEKLDSLHIRYEIDLRTNTERTQSPSRWGQNSPQLIAISVGEPPKTDLSQSMAKSIGSLKTPADADRFMQQTTARLAIEGAPQIGDVVRLLANGDEPALIHCTAGKDRTGITIAVLMSILGAPRNEVYTEYERSNAAVAEQLTRMKARDRSGASFGIPSVPPDVLRTLLGTKKSYMEAMFNGIDAQFGSFDAYVANGLKITPAQVDALRSRLLNP